MVTVRRNINTGAVRIAATPMVGRDADKRGFASLFGVSEEVVANTWEICEFPKGFMLKHLLWSLLFLKVYANETTLLRISGANCRATRKF